MDEDDYRARTREPPRSDDAGGGRRGTRPSISAELLRVLDRDFGVALAHRDADLGGSSNLNLLTRDREVVPVSDFDSMGVRPRVDDLVLTLYYAGIMRPERARPMAPSRRCAGSSARTGRPSGSRYRPPSAPAIPVAIARQPLWSFGAWIARLDDERAARAHAAGLQPHVDWALRAIGDLRRWRTRSRDAGYADAAMPAVRLQHASVQVPPGLLGECRRFYAEAIGMTPIPNRAGIAWFSFGDGDHVHLLDGEGAGGSSAHMALQVDDLDATLERCRAAGAEPRRGSDLWGAQRWFVRDPAGNLIELFEVSPPVR